MGRLKSDPVEVENTVEERMRAAGLWHLVDREQSQFADFQDGVFVEIVVREGTAVADTEKMLRGVAEEYAKKGVGVNFVARADWKLVPDSVQRTEVAHSPAGVVRAAVLFSARLLSGARETGVEVAVTLAALELLRQRLGFTGRISLGWDPDNGDVPEKALREIVETYLEQYLNYGGVSYWDPLRYPRLDLNETSMAVLFGQSAKFLELLQAINDAFEVIVVRDFLNSFRILGRKVSDFDNALPELTLFLGGAYKRGQVFSISASSLFADLGPAEQRLIRGYYKGKVESLKRQHPSLAQEFSAVF